MRYWLAIFKDEENNLNGFSLFSDVTRKQFEKMLLCHFSEKGDFHIVVNEWDSVYYPTRNSLLDHIEWKEIPVEQSRILSGIFNGTPTNTIGTFGTFPEFKNVDDLEEGDFHVDEGPAG